MGLKLACEKGSFGSEVVWIGTHLVVNSKANKVEVRLLAKKNVEIFAALSDLMDGPGAMMRSGRSLARRDGVASFLPQLKPFVGIRLETKSILCTSDKYDPHCRGCGGSMNIKRGELVRHLFLVDQLLDGLVLEVDASTTGGGAACWHGDRRRSQREPPDAFVCTQKMSSCCLRCGVTPFTRQHGRPLWHCWQSGILSH